MNTVIALVSAALAWAVLFVPSRTRFWPRALTVGPLMVLVAVMLRSLADPAYDWFGSTDPSDVLVGLMLAVVAWAAVRWGYGPSQRVVPWLTRHADDLFDLRGSFEPRLILAATAVMGVGEELLFRGVLQPEIGLLGATAVYAGLQLLGRNPLMFLMGVLGGLVWGGLYELTGSLVPSLLSHVLPIAATAFAPPGAVARAADAARTDDD